MSGIFHVRFWLFLLGALAAGVFWIGIYVGISYFLGEEIAKLVGKIGTKALIGVITLVVVGAVDQGRVVEVARPAARHGWPGRNPSEVKPRQTDQRPPRPTGLRL